MAISDTDSFIISIYIVLCCVSITIGTNLHVNASETDDLPVPQPFVDILISDYFNVEQQLWRRIDNRADNILLQVYKKHEIYFDHVIGQSGSGILGNKFIPNIDMLISTVSNINSTTESGQTHLKEKILDRASITEYAKTGLKILKDASNLFEYVMKDDVWENIISVSGK